MVTPLNPATLTAILGPTNTGKTHYAVERMLARQSGVIGLPLRLLAREIYDRIVAIKGAAQCALITGEEKILPPKARYFVCTVEAMPIERDFAFLAIDEVQLMANHERGHIFTDRVLHARGREETLLLGAETIRPVLQALLPKIRFDHRERFSALHFAGESKINPPAQALSDCRFFNSRSLCPSRAYTALPRRCCRRYGRVIPAHTQCPSRAVPKRRS